MAAVVALVPDLLFGSKVEGMLAAGGHEVTLVADPARALELAGEADVLVVDLAGGQVDGPARLAGGPPGARTLGFFSHVEPEVREAALAAGFDQVVPRSRMNREGADLVSALASGP
ncbi:MAG: hypothetical protein FGM34_05420 [Solirubrobacteraceae bacterium]|nr:hypothetical protein [Solirubrobacteraceae bacterium]